LINHGNAGVQRVFGHGKRDRLAVEQHCAESRRHCSRDDLGQCRLAGAVLADKSMDFAGLERKVDVLDCSDAAILLGDGTHLEQRAHCSTSSSTGMARMTSPPLLATNRFSECSRTLVVPWREPSALLCRLRVGSKSPLSLMTRP